MKSTGTVLVSNILNREEFECAYTDAGEIIGLSSIPEYQITEEGSSSIIATKSCLLNSIFKQLVKITYKIDQIMKVLVIITHLCSESDLLLTSKVILASYLNIEWIQLFVAILALQPSSVI